MCFPLLLLKIKSFWGLHFWQMYIYSIKHWSFCLTLLLWMALMFNKKHEFILAVIKIEMIQILKEDSYDHWDFILCLYDFEIYSLQEKYNGPPLLSQRIFYPVHLCDISPCHTPKIIQKCQQNCENWDTRFLSELSQKLFVNCPRFQWIWSDPIFFTQNSILNQWHVTDFYSFWQVLTCPNVTIIPKNKK